MTDDQLANFVTAVVVALPLLYLALMAGVAVLGAAVYLYGCFKRKETP